MSKLRVIFFLSLIICFFSARATTDQELLESKKCSSVFSYFEQQHNMPKDTLHAISLQETQKAHSKHKLPLVWPWTINSKGKGYHFKNRDEAIAFAQKQIKAGNNSIDVGCMQINLKYHPDAFESLEQAFSPRLNVAYSAKFLKSHYNKTVNWNKAIGRYHSGEQLKAQKYQTSVRKFSDSMLSYKQKLENLAHNPQYKQNANTKAAKTNTKKRILADAKVQVNVGHLQDSNWFRKMQ